MSSIFTVFFIIDDKFFKQEKNEPKRVIEFLFFLKIDEQLPKYPKKHLRTTPQSPGLGLKKLVNSYQESFNYLINRFLFTKSKCLKLNNLLAGNLADSCLMYKGRIDIACEKLG